MMFAVKRNSTGWRVIESEEDVGEDEILSLDQPQPRSISPWENYQKTARLELESTSKTMERIVEGVSLGTCKLDSADVVAFMGARKARRDVLSQPSGDPSIALPELIYPQGT